MTANNVIAFPKAKRNTPGQTMDEVYHQVNLARSDHVDLVLEYALEYLGQRIIDEGFDIGQEKCNSIMLLVENLLKAAMFRSIDLYHPFAEIADEVVSAMDKADPEEKS